MCRQNLRVWLVAFTGLWVVLFAVGWFVQPLVDHLSAGRQLAIGFVGAVALGLPGLWLVERISTLPRFNQTEES